MFVHSVYFWLLPSSSADQQAQFLAGLRTLLAIPDIAQAYIGPPAATRDDVIEHGYSYALTLLFADQAAHDRYQIHPLHQQFIANFSPLLAQVRVFDSSCDSPCDNESL